jgi:hypothetical protein
MGDPIVGLENLNIPLLRKIQRRIKREPRQFMMSHFFLDNPEEIPNCGTAACIAGWAATLSRKANPARVNHQIKEVTSRINSHYPDSSSMTEAVAAEKLGLHRDIARRLFYTNHWPNKFESAWAEASYDGPNHVPLYAERAEIACQRIDYFIKTGE